MHAYWALLFAAVLAVSFASSLAFVMLRRLAVAAIPRLAGSFVKYCPAFAAALGSQERVQLALQTTRACNEGRSEESVRLAGKLLDMEGRFSWAFVNCAINSMISAGLYREALRIPTRWRTPERRQQRAFDPSGYLLVQINLVEALYNLGRLGCAMNVLDGISADSARRGTRLVRAGLLVQRAWLEVLRGQPANALESVRLVKPRNLPRLYRAEVAFTLAAALRDLGRLDEAWEAAERGLTQSRRQSSKRNALFLLGSIAARKGQTQHAILLLEQGASHPYRGQGGDGLLLLGDLYGLVGRDAEQRTAYQWAAQRDPQSGASRVALRKLRTS
jgi:tetratricopeptide (TPR) repeat protein